MTQTDRSVYFNGMLSLTRSYRPAGRSAEFEALFALRGPWWWLIHDAPGHLTTLVTALGDDEYLVTDLWATQRDYANFAARNAADKASIEAYAAALHVAPRPAAVTHRG